MKKIIATAALLFAATVNAQIRFEKGYFIDNSGKRNEVLIRNTDWKNNPTEFEYRTGSSPDTEKQNIRNVREFGIDGQSRYIRETVLIDRSPEQMNTMSHERAPEFNEETVFLKYLVDGKADLLYYESKDIRRFLFRIDDNEIRQLVYKPYYFTEMQITYNEDYKKQLAENLKCDTSLADFDQVKYNTKDLIRTFTAYNGCSGDTVPATYEISEKRDLFNLNIRPGVHFATFETENFYYNSTNTTQFDRKPSFRIGVEAEFILPFNKNKWALFAEPTYQSYKAETESVVYPGQYFESTSKRSIDYKSIELPFGIRHYFFLSSRSKLFINAAYVFDFELNSSIRYDYREFKIFSGNNLAFGAGFKYNDRFLIEFRASTARNLMLNYANWTSKYQTYSLVLGYTVF